MLNPSARVRAGRRVASTTGFLIPLFLAPGEGPPVRAEPVAAAARTPDRAAPRIVVARPDAPVNGERPDDPHVEPYVAARPGAADHLLAGSIVTSAARGAGPWHCAAFLSTDGGATWSRRAFDMRRCIDPWVTFTDDGGALFSGIEIIDDAEGAARLHLVVFRSGDGGRTWPSDPLSLGRGHDHAMMAVDRTGGPRDGTVYLTSQLTDTVGDSTRPAVVLYSSRDGGRSFDHLADHGSRALSVRPTGITVLSDGTLALTYQERFSDSRAADDGAGPARLDHALRSGDGGRTFSLASRVTDACGDAPEFQGYPVLAVDASAGPFRDHLYYACILEDFGGVMAVRSEDGGRRWADPLRLDPDPAEGPPHVRTPMLAVNGDGVVGAAWYDRRNDPDRECQDVYFTASVDGGRTWLEPLRVSTETSCPSAAGNGRAGESWPMGGDYGSLAAGPDGRFHLLWADSRTGVFQLRGATLRVEPGRRATPRPGHARPGF